MRIFAFFLPQFHEIPENNEWWGKGFTEWTNVKKAKPLFNGHTQPIHPLADNYYDLLDKKTVLWQTDLMKKYGIDGMIYYHYYFNGKHLLEKPAENLLMWREIEQPFFFCWANHSWKKSWDGTQQILIEQSYGEKADWEKHFQYLLPYFQDERYEKIDNKPVFMVFNSEFKEKKQMAEYFNQRCVESGFNGITWIETSPWSRRKKVSVIEENKALSSAKILFREPVCAKDIRDTQPIFGTLLRFRRIWERVADKFHFSLPVCIYKGDYLYSLMLRNLRRGNNIIHSVFFEWDNTSRHGKRGYIITPVSKKSFFEYMNAIKDEDYCIVNAWNEWCEGMMLEPTEEKGCRYLEWIREWRKLSER